MLKYIKLFSRNFNLSRKIWYYEDEIESLVGVERFIGK